MNLFHTAKNIFILLFIFSPFAKTDTVYLNQWVASTPHVYNGTDVAVTKPSFDLVNKYPGIMSVIFSSCSAGLINWPVVGIFPNGNNTSVLSYENSTGCLDKNNRGLLTLMQINNFPNVVLEPYNRPLKKFTYLSFETSVSVPEVYFSGEHHAYVQLWFNISTTNQAWNGTPGIINNMPVGVTLFHTKASLAYSSQNDVNGNYPYANFYLNGSADMNNYVSNMTPVGMQTKAFSDQKFFKYHISRQQFKNIIQRLASALPAGSTFNSAFSKCLNADDCSSLQVHQVNSYSELGHDSVYSSAIKVNITNSVFRACNASDSYNSGPKGVCYY